MILPLLLKVDKISYRLFSLHNVSHPGKGDGTLGSGSVQLLSQYGSVTQSSVGWGGVPERAVDGNVRGDWGGRYAYLVYILAYSVFF